MSAATNPPTFSQDGRQVNIGLEVNFAWDLFHGLHAILSGSFIDSRQRFTGDPTIEGKRTASVPAATERINLNWDIPRTKALALDCNLMFTGAAAFDATNSYDVPAWISTDLGLRYSFPKEKPFTIQSASSKRGQFFLLGFRVFRRAGSSLQDESEKSISLPGWIGLNGMDWAADGLSFWVSACTQHSSLWGEPNTCKLVNAGLNGRITPLIDGRDIHFFAAIPSPNGDRLALDGETGDNSNVWIVRADR